MNSIIRKGKRIMNKGVVLALPICLGAMLATSAKDNRADAMEISSSVIEARSNVEYTPVTPENLNIMGYFPVNYAQVMSYMLTYGDDVLNKIDLQGLTLEEHLFNLNYVCEIEGVNPIFMLTQQLIETGNFSFLKPDGGFSMVSPLDYNFAGLGATVPTRPQDVEIFKKNIHGQLAQAQHLKGYATKEDMNAPLVDNRLKYLENKRGSIRNASDLSNQWAMNGDYGIILANKYNEIMSHMPSKELIENYKGRTYGVEGNDLRMGVGGK